MADEVIRRQGSATDHQSFTGAAGEITVENTNWNLRIHDGSTAGGHTTLMDSDLAARGGTVPEEDRPISSKDTAQGLLFSTFGFVASDSGDSSTELILDANRSSTDQTLGLISGLWNGNRVSQIIFNSGFDSTNKDDGQIAFGTSQSGGSPQTRMEIFPNGGVTAGSPSGGSRGAGTINAEELYDNGNRVATSDYVFDADQDGEIDTAHYDAAIGTKEVDSETETEEVEEEVEVTETVEEPVDEWCPDKGCYERRMVQRERPVMDEYPVLDADGNRISTKRIPRKETRKVQRPKRVNVQLEHKPARRFEHDDLDPATFAAKCHARRKLPAMDRCEQNLREGQERPSMGEWTQALMETCEVYAVHVSRLCDEIDSLKARIDALESK